jgi:hypothetical protein
MRQIFVAARRLVGNYLGNNWCRLLPKRSFLRLLLKAK